MADPTYSYPPASEPGPINDSRYKSIPIVEDADGTFHNISDAAPMPTKIKSFPDSPNFDAFSRLRVSNPVPLFDSQSQYDDSTKDTFFHKATGAASSSHDINQACVDMVTTTGATDAYIRQSQRYIRYQPGKSQLVFITFDFSAVDGGTKKAGYFDGDNGIYFEMAADGSLAIVKRSKQSGSVVDTGANRIEQASWNTDVFDGTGPSGHTLDGTQSQILVIDLQWLGVGRVRVGFDIEGHIHYAHEFLWANANNGVSMSTANLPIRYELTGNGSVSHLFAICAAVMSEGGFVGDLGHEHVTPVGTTGISCSTGSETHLISIRPKALFKTYANRGEYQVTGISFFVTDKPILLRLYHGSTLTGGAWVSSDAEGGIEYNITNTVSANGHLTNSEYGAAASGGSKSFSTTGGAESTNKIYLTLDIDAANVDNGNFTVVGTGIGGTATVYCNVHWTEIK